MREGALMVRTKNLNEIEVRLRKIGKATFVNYLYAELRNDLDVTIEYISHKYKTFGAYKLPSQQTRLSNARTIFKSGWPELALQNIAESKKTDKETKKKAMFFCFRHEKYNYMQF